MAERGPNPFIITTPLKQPDPVSKRNARSYAMRGKNSGKSRKSVVKKPCLGSWINGQLDNKWYQDPKPPSHEVACTNLIPRQVGSEWALFRFAEQIEPHMLQSIFQFYAVLERALHPKQVFATDHCDPQASIWLSYFGQSQTFFHAQLFITTAYFDSIGDGDGDIGPLATLHMTKALSFLQTDLAIRDRATTEATISIVTAFAMYAFVLGDIGSAEKHLHGLFKLVSMRGGLRSLRAHHHLQTKCCRLDLGYAMSTSSKPLFFADDDMSWNSYLPRSTSVFHNTAIHVLRGNSTSDPRMVNVWYDLYEFSRAANIAIQTGRKLESELLDQVMISVQYRLLHLQYDNEDAHELLRMVLLAYSTTIFSPLFSHFGALPLSYPSLPTCLRGLLNTLEQPSNEKLKVLLWLLIVVRISMLDDELIDLQLSQTVQALGLSSWDEILVVLKGFLWVDMLHEEQVKKILIIYRPLALID